MAGGEISAGAVAGVFLGVISVGAVIVMAARLVCQLVNGRTGL